ncbi:ZYBA0S16-00848g1_1 [Zygosaccharomyces bailii CLIB 213]|uniref:ZYBA0S16-00848g1_1 n=1 Tax=Zygosaccharomyces bailii (strain CLIB 213 / ATCC 58445 / CBS 680 / BCRC 21525 / NBRC 1098 / NCYC 1416 / NRRL Y-2227) TaxID=1333698 RepID=A0A8J2TED4_ZYGB2|nr:ZYBA0S16-00848g1_1 [Zygosaccharomyces bailii CLIB 213]
MHIQMQLSTLVSLSSFACLASLASFSEASKWSEDWPFSGLQTFAKLPFHRCLVEPTEFDIAIIGVPFDTAVTFRPGARFGPQAIRRASQRQNELRGFNVRAGINPYQDWATVVDCGDVPVTPMDNQLALKQMNEAYKELLATPQEERWPQQSPAPPRLMTLGGDHSVILLALRALHAHYGPIAVVHLDSHLDTWSPSSYPSYWHSNTSEFTHGSMLWLAAREGLLATGHCVHAGIRTRISGNGWDDYKEDDRVGFHRIHADEMMDLTPRGVARKIKNLIPKGMPVYLSVDIDVLDPSAAPGTGTVEPGGWLTRELIAVLRNLEDLPLVGADVVEVSPPFDHADVTAMAAAQVAYEIVTSMVKTPLKGNLKGGQFFASTNE